MIINEIKEVLALGNIKEYKKFGITMGIFFLLISIFLYWKEYSSLVYFLSIAVVFLAAAFIIPKILKYMYNIWMGFAAIMGYMYYTLHTPLYNAGMVLHSIQIKNMLDSYVKHQVDYVY